MYMTLYDNVLTHSSKRLNLNCYHPYVYICIYMCVVKVLLIRNPYFTTLLATLPINIYNILYTDDNAHMPTFFSVVFFLIEIVITRRIRGVRTVFCLYNK